MMDTDSLCMDLPDTFYDDVKKDPVFREWFDFGNYPKDHELYKLTKRRHGQLGTFKPDFVNKNAKTPAQRIRVVEEMVALASKCNSVKFTDGTYKQTAKGVPKKQRKTHETYLKVLLNDESPKPEDKAIIYRSIQSVKGQLHTIKVNKIGYSSVDLKFYRLDALHSVPYGYYKNSKSEK